MLNSSIWFCLKSSLQILGWWLTSSADSATATAIVPQGKVVGGHLSPSSFLFDGAQGTCTSWLNSGACSVSALPPNLYLSTQKGRAAPCWEGRSLDQKRTLSQFFGCSSLLLSGTTFLTWGRQVQTMCTLHPVALKLRAICFLCLRIYATPAGLLQILVHFTSANNTQSKFKTALIIIKILFMFLF